MDVRSTDSTVRREGGCQHSTAQHSKARHSTQPPPPPPSPSQLSQQTYTWSDNDAAEGRILDVIHLYHSIARLRWMVGINSHVSKTSGIRRCELHKMGQSDRQDVRTSDYAARQAATYLDQHTPSSVVTNGRVDNSEP